MGYPEPARSAYPLFIPGITRWRDNDVYGHMNNVVYSEYFDTAVNRWLVSSGALDVPHGPVICLVAESAVRFLSGLGYPDRVETGVSVLHAGRSSIIYGLGLFREGEESAAALCRYVHVCVGAESRTPEPIPDSLREALKKLAINAPEGESGLRAGQPGPGSR